ncbi:catenin delta-2-like isoform X2 [Uloborus diversus]|uniref:catenin delta-2-like isoform X2 n=1 Tax=Uloborus diversus TaxID=327109 RepID=UPI00240935B3|nr:catenin delta-2-like isoform X2 [Uloborus diversus]
MSEPHLHYYPDHGSSLPEYLQEGIPEVQESYSMSYQTSTSTNGHGDEDASSNNSQSSVPVDNASLISRSTAQTKTQEHKTITKVIKTREVVHHMTPPHPNAPTSDFLPYPTNVPHDREYTYDPGRPPSPAGQTPHTTQVYPHDYVATYGRGTASPSAVRNFMYSPQTQYAEYGYHDYPEKKSHTHTPSERGSSDSPNLHRAMPQAPRAVASDYNHHEGGPCNYEHIEGALGVPPRIEYPRRTPSPTLSESADPHTYGVYGCPRPGTAVEATPLSPGYQYNIPEGGYLDRRPSYDAETLSRTKGSLENTTYGRTAPRTVFEEDREHSLPPSSADGSHVYPDGSVVASRVHSHLDYAKPPDSESGKKFQSFRDPSLLEVIEFLGHPNNCVKANAAAYLWHLAYMDDNTKLKARSLGAIPNLVQLLNHDIAEIQRNSCGALRNLSYGKQNDENKRAIRAAGGIPALVRLIRKTADNEIRELVTSILWNLSSCEDLKHNIIDDALNVLVNHVIIPHSGYDGRRNPLDPLVDEIKPERVMDMYCTTVFRNSSGVLRNVSSAGFYARKKLRECEGLIESLVFLLRAVVSKSDMDNKSLENVVCTLRNLSYRIQEVEDPTYDEDKAQKTAARASAPIRAVSELGCFSVNKKKKDLLTAEREVPLTKNPIRDSDPVRGAALLHQFEVANCYLSLLVESSNPDILEASAGALMNLAAGYPSFSPSIEIRSYIRKQKALPILVELLRMSNDRVVCASARALRNMTIDARNRDLIGSYALKDLVLKLPNGSRDHDMEISDDTCSAVLATLNEVVGKQSDFARSLLQIGGIDRLVKITQQKDAFSPRVHKFASQLLYNMWQHLELREAFRKAGWKESHFITHHKGTRNSLSSPTGASSTLNRTVSSKGGTKYEDHRTLPQGTDLNSSAGPIPYSRSEGELPLSELGHSSEPPPPSQVHRPHIGVFPSGMPPHGY